MGDLFGLISESANKFGLVHTIIYLVLTLGVMYFLNNFTKQSKMSSEYLAEVIKDNRDMSEKQLEILNVLVGKITTMVEFTQALVGHVLEKDGD
jgi:hypothetical protein